MNLNPSHSQTPSFGNNKSQTTAILYQQPTESEMRSKPNLLNRLGDVVAATVLIVTISALTLMTVHGCASDVDRQERMAVKHQLQFSNSNAVIVRSAQ